MERGESAVKKTRKTKVVVAVTIPELPEGWNAGTFVTFLRDAIHERAVHTGGGLTDYTERATLRVQSTVETTHYDASVGGKRGGGGDNSHG